MRFIISRAQPTTTADADTDVSCQPSGGYDRVLSSGGAW